MLATLSVGVELDTILENIKTNAMSATLAIVAIILIPIGQYSPATSMTLSVSISTAYVFL